MQFTNQKQPLQLAQAGPRNRSLHMHIFALGGSGPLILDAMVQNLLAVRREEGYPVTDISCAIIDLDLESDSKENAKRNGIAPAVPPQHAGLLRGPGLSAQHPGGGADPEPA